MAGVDKAMGHHVEIAPARARVLAVVKKKDVGQVRRTSVEDQQYKAELDLQGKKGKKYIWGRTRTET